MSTETGASRPRSRLTGLWRNSDFLKLWAGQTVSTFGHLLGALSFTAILILDATPLQVALLAAAVQVPQLLFGFVAGAWVDRVRRRPVLIGADLGRAALLGSIPVAFLMGVLRIEQLYLVAFASGTLRILSVVAYRSYLPSLVQREELVEANSKLSASESAAEVVAFGLGGWIAQWLTANANTLMNSVSYLFSAVFVSLIRIGEPEPVGASERPSVRQEVAEGVRVVWRHRFPPRGRHQ